MERFNEPITQYLPSGILPIKARWIIAVRIVKVALEVFAGDKWLLSELWGDEIIYHIKARVKPEKGVDDGD